MIAKFVALVCLFGLARAGHLYGGLGYGAVAPAYTAYAAPIVTKTIAPVAYAPAVSSVSQYSIHSAPIVKSYAPVAYSAPIVSHGYAPALSYGYGSHGYGGYGGYGSYGGYSGYGKYAW